jgi:hypothetical protein
LFDSNLIHCRLITHVDNRRKMMSALQTEAEDRPPVLVVSRDRPAFQGRVFICIFGNIRPVAASRKIKVFRDSYHEGPTSSATREAQATHSRTVRAVAINPLTFENRGGLYWAVPVRVFRRCCLRPFRLSSLLSYRYCPLSHFVFSNPKSKPSDTQSIPGREKDPYVA